MARRLLLSTSALLFSFELTSRAQSQDRGVWLITADEATLPPSPTSKAGRAITRGPAIRQVLPSGPVPSRQPFNFKIEFAGRGGEKINPASVRVILLRGSDVDITDRLRPYIKASGIELPAAIVPPGSYVLLVAVDDFGGRQSVASIGIEAR